MNTLQGVNIITFMSIFDQVFLTSEWGNTLKRKGWIHVHENKLKKINLVFEKYFRLCAVILYASINEK